MDHGLGDVLGHWVSAVTHRVMAATSTSAVAMMCLAKTHPPVARHHVAGKRRAGVTRHAVVIAHAYVKGFDGGLRHVALQNGFGAAKSAGACWTNFSDA